MDTQTANRNPKNNILGAAQMNLSDLTRIKNILVLSENKEPSLKEFPHITTSSHPLTLIDISKGLASENITPIIVTDHITLPKNEKLTEHIIILTKKHIETENISHIEPSTEKEFKEAVIYASLEKKPHIITPSITGKKHDAFTIGRLDMLETGEHSTIISDTTAITSAIKDTQKLKEQGINCTLLHCHTLNPLDKHTLLSCAQTTKNIVCTPRIAQKIASILKEHTQTSITIAENNEFINAVRTSIKKIL